MGDEWHTADFDRLFNGSSPTDDESTTTAGKGVQNQEMFRKK
jgi:hypothetical protein